MREEGAGKGVSEALPALPPRLLACCKLCGPREPTTPPPCCSWYPLLQLAIDHIKQFDKNGA